MELQQIKIPKGFEVYSENQPEKCPTPSGVAEDAMFHFCYKHGIPPESYIHQIIATPEACLPIGRDDIIISE